MLVREYIRRSLYGPGGYFARAVGPFVACESPATWRTMAGRRDYDAFVASLYAAARSDARSHPQVAYDRPCWHTASEVFRPEYGRILGRALLKPMLETNSAAGSCHPNSRPSTTAPIVVYEIGPGRGSLAMDMLDWLAAEHASVYALCNYVLVEAAEGIAAALVKRFRASKHAARVSVHCDKGLPFDARPAFVLGVEVLDNLVHDVVRLPPTVCAMGADEGRVADGRMHFSPLSDQRITAFLHQYRVFLPGSLLRSTHHWIPTGAEALLKSIHSALPNVQALVFADFHALPDVLMRGRNAPLVQAIDQHGVPLACDTLCMPVGTVDIMFPTDFALLSRMLSDIFSMPLECSVVSHSDFVKAHSDIRSLTTALGYCPIAEDYSNQTVLIARLVN